LIPPSGRSRVPRGLSLAVLLLALLAVVALVFAWRADQRVRGSERELVKRQQDSALQITEAALLARQAQEGARDAAAKVALLEARLNEVAIQRGQLEALVQSVARSRDENLVADSEATLRAGLQQAALTGSAEPVVASLKQIDERFARANQPRLEPVRRAGRTRPRPRQGGERRRRRHALDPDRRGGPAGRRAAAALGRRAAPRPRARRRRRRAARLAASASGVGAWLSREFGQAGRAIVEGTVVGDPLARRVTRIDQPEAMLWRRAGVLPQGERQAAPAQRALSLLARQFDAARGDLRWCKGAIERYFDRSSRRTQIALDLLSRSSSSRASRRRCVRRHVRRARGRRQ
jgi:uroporphyrin-3 C-methyltransferase